MSRNIKDIAPLLVGHFVDIEDDQAVFGNNKKLVQDNAQRLGLFYRYLGLLHDSWIMKTNIADDKFSIVLNDFTTHVFSDVIVDRNKLNIDHDKLIFPIQLEFEISNLSFNSVGEDGNIKDIKPTAVNEYLHEQIISIDHDKMEIGLVVWKDGINNKQGKQILILMNVKKITLTELQEKAWVGIFGSAYDNHYRYFKEQLDTGRYLSDQSSCYKLYDEFEG